MILMADKLQSTLEKRIREAGLEEFYDGDRSQYLDLDGEVFAEIVLKDGSVLDVAEKLVRQTAEELAQQGIKLESVVRAMWDVESVEYLNAATMPDFSLRAADEFRVVVKSGRRQRQLRVHVTSAATEIVRHKLGLSGSIAADGLHPEYFLREILTPRVREFLEHELSRGGTGYWNPLQKDSPIVLTATDMSFLLGQSTAFDELRQAISDAFDPPVVDSFLGSLSASGIKVHDFDAVLPELSNMLGGAYRKGETFSTSASDLFRRLDRTEQELLRKYFGGKLAQLKSDPRFAALPKKYPGVFAGV
jgi:hypothetical protein